jgi:hypothetical protein
MIEYRGSDEAKHKACVIGLRVRVHKSALQAVTGQRRQKLTKL